MTGVLAWLVAVAAATLVGLTAVNAIGSGIVGPGQQPLAPGQVDARILAGPSAGASVAPGTPAPSTSSTPGLPSTPSLQTRPTSPVSPPTVVGPPGPPAAFTTHGGTVIARCTGGRPEILATTPAQGFQVIADQDLDDGPGVKFLAGETEVEVELSCAGATPQAKIQPPE